MFQQHFGSALAGASFAEVSLCAATWTTNAPSTQYFITKLKYLK